MMMTTTAVLISGSGSLKGSDDQLSLPSISAYLPWHGRSDSGLWGTRRRLVDDALEQLGRDGAICRRRGRARLFEVGDAGFIERSPGAPHLRNPGLEITARHRL